MTIYLKEIGSINALDIAVAASRDDFAKNWVQKILARFPDINQDKLAKICNDYFNIFSELQRVSCWNDVATTANRSSRRKHIYRDTQSQWQIYAAYFYYRLACDEGFECEYKIAEFEKEHPGLEFKLSCLKEETAGLGGEIAPIVLGRIIREAMDCIAVHFNCIAIPTWNQIPDDHKSYIAKIGAKPIDIAGITYR